MSTQLFVCNIILELYHQTSPENASKILEANAMQPGSRNTYAGAGMYFAAMWSLRWWRQWWRVQRSTTGDSRAEQWGREV
jgi:hypothetical protein